MKRLHKTMNRIVGVLLMALMMVPSGLKAETAEMLQTSKTVSYTHLTLPTNSLV